MWSHTSESALEGLYLSSKEDEEAVPVESDLTIDEADIEWKWYVNITIEEIPPGRAEDAGGGGVFSRSKSSKKRCVKKRVIIFCLFFFNFTNIFFSAKKKEETSKVSSQAIV